MSVLTHRCRACGHLEDRHAARERGYQPCPCCNGDRSSVDPDLDPEPELLPTYALPGHLPEPLWAPGATRNTGTSHTTRTCACERCRAAARAPEDPDNVTGFGPSPIDWQTGGVFTSAVTAHQ